MLSLRSFHLFFILLSIVGADLFCVWAVRYWADSGDAVILSLGVAAAVGGLGLIVYAVTLVRRFNAAKIG